MECNVSLFYAFLRISLRKTNILKRTKLNLIVLLKNYDINVKNVLVNKVDIFYTTKGKKRVWKKIKKSVFRIDYINEHYGLHNKNSIDGIIHFKVINGLARLGL